MGKTSCPLSPVTIRLDAQFGTPYPRSAGFDTDSGTKKYKPQEKCLSINLYKKKGKNDTKTMNLLKEQNLITFLLNVHNLKNRIKYYFQVQLLKLKKFKTYNVCQLC